MPKRKGIHFTEQDVSHAKIIKEVNVGKTRSTYLLDQLRGETEADIATRFAHGKIYLKKDKFSKGKQRAQRAFFKPLLGRNAEEQRKHGERELQILEKLRNAGAKVIPKAGLVQVGGQVYMAVSPFLRTQNYRSILIPINSYAGQSIPAFLERLRVSRDSKLIKDLATDFSKMVNSGISTSYFDFFSFVRKGETWERFVSDSNHLIDLPFDMTHAYRIAYGIKSVWGKRKFANELNLFKTELFNKITDPKIRAMFEKAFNTSKFMLFFKSS